MRRSAPLGVVLVGAAASLLGCGGQTPIAPSPTPSATAHPTNTATAVHVSVTSTLSLGTQPIASLAIWSNYIAWSREAGSGLVPHAIEVYNRTTKVTQTVVTATDPLQVSGPAGDGPLMVYTEANPTDEQRTTWKVHLHSLSQGWDRVLASSAFGTPIPYVPQPAIKGNCVAWSEPYGTSASDVRTRIKIYDAATGNQQTVSAGYPNSVTIDNGRVFFAADQGSGRDAFVVPCTSAGSPVRLTTSGRVSYPAAANGLLVWQEPLQGDPTSVWAMDDRGGGASPVQMTDLQNQGNALPGRGFALWLDAYGHLTVRDATAHLPAVTLPHQEQLSIAARWSVLDDTLVWVNGEGPDGRALTLYVGQVATPGSS